LKPVLVLTATGRIGRHVVAGLSEAGVQVRAVTRDEKRAREMFTSQGLAMGVVEFVQADVHDGAAVRAAAEGCGQAYIASSDDPEQVQMEVEAARVALDAGAEHIVKLSSCDAAADAPFSWARHHAAIEEQIVGMTGEYSILRPHYFMQNLLSLAGEIRCTGAISIPTGEGRIGMIDARDIAAVAVKLLTEENPVRRTVELTGPEPVSFARVVAEISGAIGAPVTFLATTDEKYLRRLIDEESMAAGQAAEVARVYTDVRDGVLDVQTDEVEKIIGRRPRTVEQFAIDYAAQFRVG
jgi:uncharacterized protein YbjT (DUF2867 family)